MKQIYDLIVIGGGPAGMTAALYAGRAGLSCLLLEKMFFGGQMLKTSEIDNFPGVPNLRDSFALADSMKSQAEAAGAELKTEEVLSLSEENGLKTVVTDSGTYTARTLILATGANPRKAEIPGEEAFSGRGVSYCATCDGAFFRNKTVAVVGGGNTALEDVAYLSAICEKVYLIHRRDTFRASRILVDRAQAAENVSFILNTNVTEVVGDGFVTGLTLNTAEEILPVDAVFFAIGTVPESGLFQGFVNTDNSGAVLTDETLQASVPGVFAAGDLRQKTLRQIVTACADGAECAYQAQRYLMEND